MKWHFDSKITEWERNEKKVYCFNFKYNLRSELHKFCSFASIFIWWRKRRENENQKNETTIMQSVFGLWRNSIKKFLLFPIWMDCFLLNAFEDAIGWSVNWLGWNIVAVYSAAALFLPSHANLWIYISEAWNDWCSWILQLLMEPQKPTPDRSTHTSANLFTLSHPNTFLYTSHH